jgi:hypothetical protein
MSATKIATSFRVSFMALIAEVDRSPSRGRLSMGRFHAALEEGVEAESASLRVDRPVYRRGSKT